MSSDEKDDDSGGSFWAGAALGGAVIGGLTFLFTRRTERPTCNVASSSSQTFRNRPLAVEKCTICQDNIDLVVKLPCSHRFHKKCVEPWVEMMKTCPTCRRPVTLTQMKNST